MTDITELAQRVKTETAAIDDTQWYLAKPSEIRSLVEALEKAQSANAAQDDHINQQQDRIEQLEKRNAELGKHVGMLEKRLKGTEESLIASTDMVTELESRTVTVKLPNQTQFDDPLSAYEAIEKCKEALTAEGIKWEAE
ncbi:hypothetical protein [Klebsiella grimontii]|uniref:hypothetical protein n=1 Tax=Klebsiella grimontii TaxID=2058152 RepID=UPI001CCD0C62|nr:hypothetical protein [Klebsiella grimontii]MBZ6730234.1 hypothetical protein [Klebsiella grimontii]MBZ7383432.1 hypothetical protein [Klebsiella grimontii]